MKQAICVLAFAAVAVVSGASTAQPRDGFPGAVVIPGDTRSSLSVVKNLSVPVRPGREEDVRAFLLPRLGIFGIERPDGGIVLDRVIEFDGATVYRYRQTYRGMNVDGGEVVAGVVGSRLVHIANGARRISGGPVDFLLDDTEAKRLVRARIRDIEIDEPSFSARRVLMPFSEVLIPVWVVEVVASAPARHDLFYVDARDGRVIQRIDLVRYAAGRVYMDSPERDGATMGVTIPNLDTSGFLRGPYADVYSNCRPPLTCKDANRQSKADGNGDFLYDPAEPDLTDPFAEVMTFYHMNRARDWFRSIGVSAMDVKVQAAANCSSYLVGVPCNAGWSAGAMMIGICLGADPLNKAHRTINFAYDADVIMHEYTHGFVEKTSAIIATLDAFGWTGMSDGINEGAADFVSGFITDDDVLGRHASLAWGPETVRNMSDFRACPENLVGEAHEDGRIFSTATWEGKRLSGHDPAAGKAVALAVASLPKTPPLKDAAEAVVSYALQVSGNPLADAFRFAYETYGLLDCGKLIEVPNGYNATGRIYSRADGALQPFLAQYVYTVPSGAASMEMAIKAWYQDSGNDALSNVTFYVNHGDYVKFVPDNTVATYTLIGDPERTINNPVPGKYYVLAAGENSTFVWSWEFKLTYSSADAPSIASLGPASARQGETVPEITVRGSDFVSGAALEMGHGITVGGTAFVDQSTLKATNVSVHPAAVPGKRDVSVSTPSGQSATGTGMFTVVEVPRLDGGFDATVPDTSYPSDGSTDGGAADGAPADRGTTDDGTMDAAYPSDVPDPSDGSGDSGSAADTGLADGGAACECDVTYDCDPDCPCDPECAAACECDVTYHCDSGCPCDPECTVPETDAGAGSAADAKEVPPSEAGEGGEGGCSCATMRVR
ncbi:MAG: hypothetical protein HY897_16765 [Deltaproteobacteria bacterium]|nr:hypothetical protein [Deltaproteobacteria bacterium]